MILNLFRISDFVIRIYRKGFAPNLRTHSALDLRNGRLGFTLVELILYVALVGILLTAGAIFASDMILGSVKGRVRARVQSEARFVIEKMRQEIVKGKSLEAIQNSVWVVNGSSYDIQKFNAITGALLGTYGTGGFTGHGIAYDPVQNVIWATGGESGAKTRRYDAGDGTQIGNNISGGSARLAYDPKQNAMWAVGNGSLINVDATDGSVSTNDTSAVNRRTAAYDSDSNAVWVTAYDLNLVQKYNASNGSFIMNASTNAGPKGVAYDVKQNAIWVANESAGTVQKFDTSGNPLLTIGNVPDAYVLTYDSKQNAVWVVANAYDKLYKFDAISGGSLGVFNTGDGPHGIIYDPVQNAIWVNNGGSPSSLQKFNAATGALLGTYVTSGGASSVAYAFNCRFLLGDDATRVSFSVNGDGKTSSLNTLQMCSKNGLGCGSADSWQDIISPDTEVTNFTCTNISSGTSLGEEAVKINLTLKNKNPGGKKEFDAEATIETSISLRL